MYGNEVKRPITGFFALIVKTRPTLTPPETEGIALIILGYQPFLRGYHWTRNATPQNLSFPNEINELVGLWGGVNVGRVFTNIPAFRSDLGVF